MIINKIKNKVKWFEHLLLKKYKLEQDTIALAQLLKLFDNKVFLPLTAWAISPKQVLHICNDIVINERKNIIEFGSGFSTICIAQLLKINKIEASFMSIENDEQWYENLKGILLKLELSEYVNVIYAPIIKVSKTIAKEGQEKWYDTLIISEEISRHQSFDLLIVDGPFGKTTPFARYSAVPFLKDRISENFAIFLDDTDRVEEKEIAQLWHQILKCFKINKDRYTYFSNKNDFDITPYGL
ncbi:class I SAM-dependent methyltransferase [Flavobacterium acetivorans]|uniref:class I SAM-dependent methyltransferase n=1 Tax=Flavobacterium acetivorans TaxID=2893883 RepID=UPI001E3091B5|nr:class I SAM-dependent methyltransferase [Flavobacterium sp. F-29]UFH35719.1 class I SAM-dependent methyltransferase [Flavobacterium sp. F-29]